MKQPTESTKMDKQNQDLTIIENSLFKVWASSKKEVITEKNKLVFKIVDNCAVSQAKAREYLNILLSREVIGLDKELIYYKPSKKRLDEIQRTLDQLDIVMPII
jgi:hypothetical protein